MSRTDGFQYKIDESYEYYMNNWVGEMDLVCVPSSQVSLMLSWLFIGTIASVVLVTVPDQFGRKYSVILGMVIALLAQIVMLLVPSLLVRSICFFLIGFSGFKNSTAYVWGSECVPFKKRTAVFTVINVVDALPTVITGLFYLLIKPDWFPVYAFNIALSSSGLLLAFACPESPRWLLYSGKQA